MDKSAFGKFVADTRRERGLTQQALAEQLHITDKAVSKWERGLSYPDLTLLEPLAEALGLTTGELLACRKDPAENVTNLLDIAKESNRHLRRRVTVLFSLILLGAVLVGGLLLFYIFRTESVTCYTEVWGKQAGTEGGIVYIEKNGDLLALDCADTGLFDSICANNREDYCLVYRWRPYNQRGILEDCRAVSVEDVVGRPTDMVGSSIGVDSLFGINCMCKEIQNVISDPNREYGYLFTYRYYYKRDGQSYYLGQNLPETTVLTVRNCCEAVQGDFDSDGVVELLVLTRYDEAPYMLYDQLDGKIVSQVVSEIPPLAEKLLSRPV